MMIYLIVVWKEVFFKDVICKVVNIELYYKLLQFYLDFRLMLINDFLMVFILCMDYICVVNFFKKVCEISYFLMFGDFIQLKFGLIDFGNCKIKCLFVYVMSQ